MVIFKDPMVNNTRMRYLNYWALCTALLCAMSALPE